MCEHHLQNMPFLQGICASTELKMCDSQLTLTKYVSVTSLLFELERTSTKKNVQVPQPCMYANPAVAHHCSNKNKEEVRGENNPLN